MRISILQLGQIVYLQAVQMSFSVVMIPASLLTCISGALGRVLAKPAILQTSTAVDRFRGQLKSCGISGGQGSTGAGFLWVLRFPLSCIPPIAPHSLVIVIRGSYIRPLIGFSTSALRSGRRIRTNAAGTRCIIQFVVQSTKCEPLGPSHLSGHSGC
jgi:hypothetical protein